MDAMIHAVANYEYKEFVELAFNPNRDDLEVEALALSVLDKLQSEAAFKDLKRYKFSQGSVRERALVAIFNRNIKRNGPAIIAAAEMLHPSNKPFYSRSKYVCRIQIPRAIGQFTNSTLFKGVSTVATCFGFCFVGLGAYNVMADFTRRSLPTIINKTPIQVIRLYNRVIELKYTIRQNILIILAVIYITKEIFRRMPEIPYVTRFVESISLNAIFSLAAAPATILSFLAARSVNVATFAWHLLTDIGTFIEARADQADKERDAICRAKANEVWRTLIL